MDENNTNLTPEEQKAETEALTEAKEDEIRGKVVSDLGLEDTEENSELIDKLVARDLEHSKTLGTAVRQKISWREKAQGSTDTDVSKQKNVAPDGQPLTAEEISKQAADATRAELEKRDLDEMGHSESVTEQIKKLAALNDTSVRAAEKDPYIQSLIEAETRQREVDAAADNGSSRSKGGVKIDLSKPLNADDFDLHTEEGQQAWAEAKQAKRDALKK